MINPTLVAILGHIDSSTTDELILLTCTGHKISIPLKSIQAKFKVEAGGGDTGLYRVFIDRTAVVQAEIFVTDLLDDGPTRPSSDTALVNRRCMRPSDPPFDAQTHWSNDTC